MLGTTMVRETGSNIRERAYRAMMRKQLPAECRKLVGELLDELDRPPSLDWMATRFALSKSEQEILEQMAHGHLPHDIAKITGRKVSTVRAHIRSIYAKTGAKSSNMLLSMIIKGPGASGPALVVNNPVVS